MSNYLSDRKYFINKRIRKEKLVNLIRRLSFGKISMTYSKFQLLARSLTRLSPIRFRSVVFILFIVENDLSAVATTTVSIANIKVDIILNGRSSTQVG